MCMCASMLILKDLQSEGFWVGKWSDPNPDKKKRTVDDVLDFIRKGESKNVPMLKSLRN